MSSAKAAGVVDYEHLKKGLRDAGIVIKDEDSFNRLVKLVDKDLDGGITFNEFETVIQSIKMAHVFKEREKKAEHVPEFCCLHYNVAKCDVSVIKGNELKEFMYSPRDQSFPQRWIHVTAPATFVLKALSIKYRIHPLAVEDALTNDPHIRAKVDNYDNHIFLAIPILSIDVATKVDECLDEDESAMLKSKYGSVSLPRRLGSSSSMNQEYMALAAGQWITPSGCNDGCVYWLGEEGEQKMYSVPKLHKNNAFIFVSRPLLNTTISVVDHATKHMFNRTQKALSVPYSRYVAVWVIEQLVS